MCKIVLSQRRVCVNVLYRWFQFLHCMLTVACTSPIESKLPNKTTSLRSHRTARASREVSDELLSSPVTQLNDRNCSFCCSFVVSTHRRIFFALQAKHMTFEHTHTIFMLIWTTHDNVMTTFNFQKTKEAMRLKFIFHRRLLPCTKRTTKVASMANWSEHICRFCSSRTVDSTDRSNLCPNGLVYIRFRAHKLSPMRWNGTGKKSEEERTLRNNNLKDRIYDYVFSLRSFKLAFYFILNHILREFNFKKMHSMLFNAAKAHCFCASLSIKSSFHSTTEDLRCCQQFPSTLCLHLHIFIFDGDCVDALHRTGFIFVTRKYEPKDTDFIFIELEKFSTTIWWPK